MEGEDKDKNEEPGETSTGTEHIADKAMGKNWRWRHMTGKRKARMAIRGPLQLALTLWTLRDIRRRSDDQIKGSKRFWTIFAFVQPVGSIAYLLFGRQRLV
jgi:hypothetical protein